MSAFFEPTIKELWDRVQDLVASRRAAELANESRTLDSEGEQDEEQPWVPRSIPTREQMAQMVGRDMAQAWLRRRTPPESLDALREEILAEKSAWAQRMIVAYRCKRALETMEDEDFVWISSGRGEDGEVQSGGAWPKNGQLVLYFFDVVGAHPGHYDGIGQGEDEFDVFHGLFGGTLGGDVTHWMPMPGMKDKPVFEVGEQHAG